MKYTTSFLALLIVFLFDVNSQVESVVGIKWHTVEKNTLELNTDTIKIDDFWHTKGVYIKSKKRKSENYIIFTDSTFKCYKVDSFEGISDTTTYITAFYKLENQKLFVFYDSLKSSIFNFFDGSLAELQGKNVVYYQGKADSAEFKFNFYGFNSVDDTLHIDDEGNIYYSTKGYHKSFYPQNYHKGRRDYEVLLRGVFKGRLDNQLFSELNSLILKSGYLREYLYLGWSKPISEGYNRHYITIGWNNHVYSSYDNDLLKNKILYIIFSRENQELNKMRYFGVNGKENPKPYRRLNPPHAYSPTLYGQLSVEDSVAIKDSMVYVYKMVVDTTLFDEDTAYKRGDVEFFVSKLKIVPTESKIGILYGDDRAFFVDLNNKVWQYKYKTLLRVFQYDFENEHIIFNRYLKWYPWPYRQQYHRTELTRMAVRSVDPSNNKFFKDYAFVNPYPRWLPNDVDFQHKLVSKLKKLKNEPFLKDSENVR